MRKRTDEALPVHAFQTLLAHPGLYQEVLLRQKGDSEDVTIFARETLPDSLHKRAFELIGCSR